ncbi:MAG TPA: SDR family oxidoreductase [Firmicutes bacterium]|nr:SDR family oxidoreductase [Bacillota bacterium]
MTKAGGSNCGSGGSVGSGGSGSSGSSGSSGILKCFDLSGKTALVTGCNKGIGRALACALAEAGADIIGVSSSLPARGSEVEQDITGLGRTFHGYTCNLTDREALKAFIAKVKATHAPIDILVNNAGTIIRQPAVNHEDEAWDTVIELNLRVPFILAREFGRDMVARRYGKIIFIASLLSFQGGILVPGYAAGKGGVAQLTKALANEWAPFGVNVNAIAPGYIATDNTAALRADPQRSRQVLERIPAGRWGTPDDLKGAIVFLSSDAAAYVHGTILTVDGGWLGR